MHMRETTSAITRLGSNHATYRVQVQGVNDKEYMVLQKKPGEVQ